MRHARTAIVTASSLLLVALAGGSQSLFAAAPTATPGAMSSMPAAIELAVVPQAEPAPSVIQLHTIGPVISIHDIVGSGHLNIRIPDGWSMVRAGDISASAAFADWHAGHPEIPGDVAATVSADLSTPGFSLLAFDAASTIDGVTPQVALTWIDAPVIDDDAWLADLGANLTKDLRLDSAPAVRSWPNLAGGSIDAYQFVYDYEASGSRMVGSELIVLLRNGRAAVLTFSCQASQAEEIGWLASAIFESLSTVD